MLEGSVSSHLSIVHLGLAWRREAEGEKRGASALMRGARKDRHLKSSLMLILGLQESITEACQTLCNPRYQSDSDWRLTVRAAAERDFARGQVPPDSSRIESR